MIFWRGGGGNDFKTKFTPLVVFNIVSLLSNDWTPPIGEVEHFNLHSHKVKKFVQLSALVEHQKLRYWGEGGGGRKSLPPTKILMGQ